MAVLCVYIGRRCCVCAHRALLRVYIKRLCMRIEGVCVQIVIVLLKGVVVFVCI